MKYLFIFFAIVSVLMFSACGETPKANNANAANAANTNSPATAAPANISTTERPQKVKDLMAARGEQDSAKPTLKIVEPKADATLTSSTVKLKLELGGDLKGYAPGMNAETHTGNHIHVILDNQPYEAYYNLGQEFELRNVMDGDHVLRVFPSRPWHESYKNDGAFQMIKFKVKKGGADPAKDTTTSTGQTIANPGATPEGKDVKPSNSGLVDPKKPLLTYSRPKGEYKGDDTNAIMIDFWMTNAKLTGDGGEYKVRYTVDDGDAKYLELWGPIWLAGFTAGTHNVKIDLLDKDGKVVDNGGYNSTTREITITK